MQQCAWACAAVTTTPRAPLIHRIACRRTAGGPRDFTVQLLGFRLLGILPRHHGLKEAVAVGGVGAAAAAVVAACRRCCCCRCCCRGGFSLYTRSHGCGGSAAGRSRQESACREFQVAAGTRRSPLAIRACSKSKTCRRGARSGNTPTQATCIVSAVPRGTRATYTIPPVRPTRPAGFPASSVLYSIVSGIILDIYERLLGAA